MYGVLFFLNEPLDWHRVLGYGFLMNPWVFEATPPGENANVPAKLEELNKTYGTPNLISEVALEELLVLFVG